MTETRKLVDGVFGAILVDYFQTEHMLTPVEAELLETVSVTESNYRITFEDESVSDWKISFPNSHTLEIEAANKYNEVL